jgi:hypothetical protein
MIILRVLWKIDPAYVARGTRPIVARVLDKET